MASLRERNGVYYIVFAKRVNGKLKQKVYSLGTKNEKKAEELKDEYGELYRLGEIDPFGSWTPKLEAERKRKQRRGITLIETIEQFLSERSHLRDITLEGYAYTLSSFAEAVGRSMPVHLITPDDVRAFCFKERYSKATQSTYLGTCKMFFNWLVQCDYVEQNVCDRIRYPKRNQRISDKVINEGQLHEIFRTFKSIQRDKVKAGKKRGLHIWFKPVVATAFYQGLRVSEVIRLRWGKVDLQQEFMRVTKTKNARERAIPLRRKFVPYLAAWHRLCGYPQEGLVFFKSNTPGTHQSKKVPLTRDNVSKVFKKYVRVAGMPEGITFHGLRHSCATELLRLGMGINEVASFLGHSDLQMTRIYEHLNERDLKNKMEKLGL